MRWYAVTINYNSRPHVLAELIGEGDAETFDRTHACYTEDEMRSHPDLTAALKRWRDPTDTEYAKDAVRAEMGGFGLQNDLDMLTNNLLLLQDLAAEAPEDPACAAVLEAAKALPEIERTFAELYHPTALKPWVGPKSAMELEREERQAKVAAQEDHAEV